MSKVNSGELKFRTTEIMKCTQNPIYFILNYVYIPETGGQLKYDDKLLHYKHRRVIKSLYRYNKCTFMASRQLGKALSVDTLIPIPTGGYKQLKDITVGDSIFDGNGNPTEVIAETPIMYDRPCYQIIFDNNETIYADENHLWKISNVSNKTHNVIKTTKELFDLESKKWKGASSCKIELPNNINYNQNNILPLHPYVLGLWLGDGAKDTNQITCFEDDYIIYKEIFKRLNYNISDHICKQGPTKQSGRFTIYGIRPILRELNLFGNKHIPLIYTTSSINDRLELLRGLMDSDGCQMKNCNSMQFYQKDFNLIKQVFQLLSSLGIKSKLTIKIIKNVEYYQLTFTTNKYQIFNLPRKNRSCKSFRNETKFVYIKSIKQCESMPVKCIQVANSDGMFLCGESMIPTHNSTIAACMIAWSIVFYPNNKAVILNMKQNAALNNLNTIKFIISKLPAWMVSTKPFKSKSDIKTYFELFNGSRVDTFYPSTIHSSSTLARSLTVPILYIDESAFIRDMAEIYGLIN